MRWWRCLILATGSLLGAPVLASELPVSATLKILAAQARPGILAVVVMDPATGRVLGEVNQNRPMPMQSVMKAPLAAFVLSKVDDGALRLEQRVTLARSDLSVPRSPINEAFPGRATYSLAELLQAAVGDSDNTAADVLLAMAGGPRAATAWLQRHGLRGMRVDRYEREFQPASVGLPRFRQEWTNETTYAAAIAAVPPSRRLAATRAYLKDRRDTATPRAAAIFMTKLARRELLSASSTQLLLAIMTRTSTGVRRLRAGLLRDAEIAHKTGTGRTVGGINQATNDIGMITYSDGHRDVVASFLAGSPATEAQREDLLASVARQVSASNR